MKQMPLFDPKHEICGLKIEEIRTMSPNPWHTNGTRTLVFEDKTFTPVDITPEWYALNRPEPGDAYVQYEDGLTRIIHAKPVVPAPKAAIPAVPGGKTALDYQRERESAAKVALPTPPTTKQVAELRPAPSVPTPWPVPPIIPTPPVPAPRPEPSVPVPFRPAPVPVPTPVPVRPPEPPVPTPVPRPINQVQGPRK